MRECRLLEAALTRQGFSLHDIRGMTLAEAASFVRLAFPTTGKAIHSYKSLRRGRDA